MALHGTLRDFGVAEILQLIAQQTKTGVLRVRGREREIHVYFENGNVVRAEQVAGKDNHLLGNRLVRAGLITERELEDALEEQRRTLRRLGDILVSRGALSREDLREMAQLQATETLYRLFTWKSGTYEFEPGEVSWDRNTIQPIRGEAILMEGFRIVDEWPLVRKRISSLRMTFEKRRELPPEKKRAPAEDDEAALDAAFGEAPVPQPTSTMLGEIGPNERRVMALVQTGRTVERLVELSRLGEFETCKALFNLVNAGYLEAIPPPREEKERPPAGEGWLRVAAERLGSFAARVAVAVGLLVLVTLLVHLVRFDGASGSRGMVVIDPAVQRLVGRAQAARIEAALELFRLESGSYPARLDDLVGAGLLEERDLGHPWRERYHYRRVAADRFVLLPPFD